MSSRREQIAGVVVADATREGCPLTYVSPGFEQLTGYRADEVLGRSCAILQGPDTDPRAVEVLRQAIAAGREAYVTIRNYRRGGEPFWNEVALAPERDAGGRVVRYLGVQKDVSARLRTEQRVRELAYHDSLTGLANRAALQEELAAALDGARVGDRQVALLFIDVDDFKLVNDMHGHGAGDALLRAIADRLRSIVRPGDVLARTGGDEFLLLVRDVPDAASLATELAARVVDSFRVPFIFQGSHELRVRASVGVSVFPRDADDVEALLGHADAAMYAAKGAGKDRFHIYTPVSRKTGYVPDDDFDPAAAIGELQRVLEHETITPVFQPIVRLASGEVVAYEALARGPEGSVLARPDRLFATAAVAGRVDELDWLCRIKAVDAALAAGLSDRVTLFVNCEPSSVDSPCPPRHAATWRRAQAELDLVLEITERAVTDRPAELSQLIDEQREHGCGIALDDVGADVRSLALLPLLEPEIIKLDLRLVQGRPSTEQAAIVSAVAAESERTGAEIVAEGIEDDEHLRVARSLGATLGQGWRWGRPGPLPAVVATRWRRPRRSAPVPLAGTPFEVIASRRPVEQATKRLLLPMSHLLENRALRIGEGAVVLSAFQQARHFTPRTRRRYDMLARGASLVAAFGVGLGSEPVAGVRGAELAQDDRLAGEWSVIVLGPHFSGALVAQDLGDRGPDSDRRFSFATSYDRDLVIAAARTLLQRITPLASPPSGPAIRPAPAGVTA